MAMRLGAGAVQGDAVSDSTENKRPLVAAVEACSRCGEPIVDGHFIVSLKDGACWHNECDTANDQQRSS